MDVGPGVQPIMHKTDNGGQIKKSAKSICIYSCILTEYFEAQEVAIFYLNNVFNLKVNCVLHTLKNSLAVFLHIIHTGG